MPNLLDTTQSPLYTKGSLQTNDYKLQPGVCVLPIAEEPPTDLQALESWSPVVVLRLHAPYRLRKYRTQQIKNNNPPIVASPGDTGKFVFIGGDIVFEPRMNITNRNFDWTVVTEYTYVENCVSRNQDGFVLGSSPWKWEASIENAQALGGIPPIPPIGAISEAGLEPIIGYYMAGSIVASIGASIGLGVVGLGTELPWGYNVPSYYPGVLLNDNLANGGGLQPSEGAVV